MLPVTDATALATATLSDLADRRRPYGGGGLPHNFIELFGGDLVPCLHYEPDPVTFRSDYYYNTSLNVLYRRVITVNLPQIGIVRSHWHRVSQ